MCAFTFSHGSRDGHGWHAPLQPSPRRAGIIPSSVEQWQSPQFSSQSPCHRVARPSRPVGLVAAAAATYARHSEVNTSMSTVCVYQERCAVCPKQWLRVVVVVDFFGACVD